MPLSIDESEVTVTAVRAQGAGGQNVNKAQNHRSQDLNRMEAFSRLHELLEQASHVPKARRATRPTRSSQQQRLNTKRLRGSVKALRSGKASAED
jgi:ribosome-associated protein